MEEWKDRVTFNGKPLTLVGEKITPCMTAPKVYPHQQCTRARYLGT